MFVEGKGALQNDLDSCRVHLLVYYYDLDSCIGHLLLGFPNNYDLDSCRGHLLIGLNFFSSIKLLTRDKFGEAN